MATLVGGINGPEGIAVGLAPVSVPVGSANGGKSIAQNQSGATSVAVDASVRPGELT